MKQLFRIILLVGLFLIPTTFSMQAQKKITGPKKNHGTGVTTTSGNQSTTKHVAVDLGLPSGTKWATCNVGASKPSDFGSYFAGNPRYDEASAKWGGSWRLPTKSEWEELLNNCKWEWTTLNGNEGYRVIGKNGKSIFLPAAGYSQDSNEYSVGNVGAYWSSNAIFDTSAKAYYLDFSYMGNPYINTENQTTNQSIRPVRD